MGGEENIENVKILRFRSLAEDLFNLQYIEGFRDLIDGQRKNPNLEPFGPNCRSDAFFAACGRHVRCGIARAFRRGLKIFGEVSNGRSVLLGGGPSGAQDEFTLAAIAQNLRRLARLMVRPPPIVALCLA